ncbi:MAG: serine/threonine-protein kinase [Bacteroidota bacterium]
MTDAERHARASALFARLADDPDRDTALGAEPDPDVREAVRRLFAAHETTGPLDRPVTDREVTADVALGSTVGPWRLAEVVGEGGMGIVYRAERADGLYEREVALKRLRPGPDTAGLAARLRSEQQILARLEHPGIARLYDGGVTSDGLPYLAMELVDGAPITAFADTHALSTRDRVRLAARVAEAVAYAHQRLVVHRDLKPSNILVEHRAEDGRQGNDSPSSPIPQASSPRVKLLDFGIAKLLDPDAADLLTRTQAALTPAYAAPEQVTGGEITTATDVYALGVLLYELLAGRRPYDLSDSTAAEAERLITEAVPPPPSSAAPAERVRMLRGDLDTVVLKALEKEPARRYPTAQALADDLHRWLGGLAVEARPATAGYRMGRFVRRHRVLAGAAAAVLVAVVGGAGAALWQAQQARAEAAKAGAMQDFLVGMLQAANPEEGDGRDVRVADLLDDAAARLDTAFAEQPETRATAHQYLGSTYYELGLLDESLVQHRRALSLYEELQGAQGPSTAIAQSYVATALRELAEYDAADSLYTLALANHVRRWGERDLRTAEVLAEIGTLRYYTGDSDGSADAHERVLAIEEAILAPDDPELVLTLGNLAVARTGQDRDEEAMALFERQIALLRTMDEPVTLANALSNLGTIYFFLDREEDAADVQAESVALFREVLGNEHPSTAFGLSNLGSTLTSLGRADEAEPLLRESVEIYREASGERHPNVGFPLINLAKAVRDLGRLDEAERYTREAGELFREGFGADHPVMERVTETLASIRDLR